MKRTDFSRAEIGRRLLAGESADSLAREVSAHSVTIEVCAMEVLQATAGYTLERFLEQLSLPRVGPITAMRNLYSQLTAAPEASQAP